MLLLLFRSRRHNKQTHKFSQHPNEIILEAMNKACTVKCPNVQLKRQPIVEKYYVNDLFAAKSLSKCVRKR